MNLNASASARTAPGYDIGLRNYMLGVYNRLLSGLVLSGLVAAFMAYATVSPDGSLNDTGKALFQGPLFILLVASPLVIVLAMTLLQGRMSATALTSLFYALTALIGVSFATLFIRYEITVISRVFFIAASMFGALSLYGYTTHRNLTGMGSFMLMGLFGLLIAVLANLYFQSTGLQSVITVIGVLVFAGFTAYDTQNIKNVYEKAGSGESLSKLSTLGALSLFLDFVNLFTHLLGLFGNDE